MLILRRGKALMHKARAETWAINVILNFRGEQMRKSIKLCTLIVACLIMGGTISAAKNKAAPAAPTGGQTFQKGAFFLGGALGLGSGMGFLGGVAFIGNAEYAVTNEIGIGGSIGYWSYTDELTVLGVTVKNKYSIIPIIASGAYHFQIGNPKLDLAAGVSLGYYVVNASSEISGGSTLGTTGIAAVSGSGIAWGVFGLARYFVTDHLALRGKLGYGITVVELGVDFKF